MHKFSCRCTSFRHVVLQIPCRFWKFCVAVLEVSFTRVHELRASTTTEGDLTWLTARTNFSSESKDLPPNSSFRRGAQPGRPFFWAQGRKNCAEPEWVDGSRSAIQRSSGQSRLLGWIGAFMVQDASLSRPRRSIKAQTSLVGTTPQFQHARGS